MRRFLIIFCIENGKGRSAVQFCNDCTIRRARLSIRDVARKGKRAAAMKNVGGYFTMVFEKVKAILSEQFDVEEDSITMESSITDDLGADSLDVVDLLMSIEDEFEVEVPDSEVENIKTVGDLVKYIEDKA